MKLVIILFIVGVLGCAKKEKLSAPPELPTGETVVESAIRKVLGKASGELTSKDMEKVVEIHLGGSGITDLTPLKKLTKLQRLYLQGNRIIKLDPLEHLTDLEFLELDNNQITDLKPLKKLNKLEGLFLDNNKISDLKPLMRMNRLRKLGLVNNPSLSGEAIGELQRRLKNCKIYGPDNE